MEGIPSIYGRVAQLHIQILEIVEKIFVIINISEFHSNSFISGCMHCRMEGLGLMLYK